MIDLAHQHDRQPAIENTILNNTVDKVELQNMYAEINRQLQSEHTITISTPTSEREKESLQVKVLNMLNKNYSPVDEPYKNRIFSEFFSNGPLEVLLQDQSITEIVINSPHHIFYEKKGQIYSHSDVFLSASSYQNFIHRLTAEARIQATLERPYADGYWQGFRIHLIIPPLTQKSTHLSLRRHPENPWTLHQFAKVDWATNEEIEIIKKIIHLKASFLVIGPTGSGKTSVINACLQEVAKNERIVIIEDTNEISIPNPLSVKLLARFDAQGVLQDIDQSQLIKQALRMRPDRIVMGEVRGAEAKDLLMALSTGHSGGMATLHAENPRQALYRLEMLVQLGAPQWSIRAIRHLIYFGLQYIIVVKKINGHRKLDGLYRITSLEESGFCLEKVERINQCKC